MNDISVFIYLLCFAAVFGMTCVYMSMMMRSTLSDFDKRPVKSYGDDTSSIPFKILQDDILKFTTEVEYSGDMHAEIWFQKYYENQFHTPHTHGTIGYSSVLYINFDKKIHKGTIFLSPFNHPDGKHIEYAPDVDEGSFIFFPSYLYHYTLPHKSDTIRIIMSMNIRKK